jgi:hypothetical protein
MKKAIKKCMKNPKKIGWIDDAQIYIPCKIWDATKICKSRYEKVKLTWIVAGCKSCMKRKTHSYFTFLDILAQLCVISQVYMNKDLCIFYLFTFFVWFFILFWFVFFCGSTEHLNTWKHRIHSPPPNTTTWDELQCSLSRSGGMQWGSPLACPSKQRERYSS